MKLFSALAVFLTCLGVVVGGPISASPAAAQTTRFVVDSNSDLSDTDTADGVCRTSAGTCSLRAALEQANVRGGSTIAFNLPSSSPIVLTKTLPLDGQRVTIDGYTQPGAVANTLRSGSNAVIKVQIDASGLYRHASSPYGIRIQGEANTIRGIAIWGADHQIRLDGEGADGNVMVGNFIGTNAAATYMSTNSLVGVSMVLGPDRNQIGRPTVADRNVISGNGSHGVLIDHGSTSENRIQNNIVGPSPLFDRNLGGRVGIDIQWWSWGNLVGGLGDLEANVVSGNRGVSGIDLSHGATNNLVMGNYVGTLGDGYTTTDWSGNMSGIVIKDGASNNYFEGNIVGASIERGIWMLTRYSHDTVFVENYVGVSPLAGSADQADIGNGGIGIQANGYDHILYRNVTGYNKNFGIVVANSVQGDAHLKEPAVTDNVRVHESTFIENHEGELKAIHNVVGRSTEISPAPVIARIGNGDIAGSVPGGCFQCRIELYVSGPATNDGMLNPGSSSAGIGAAWVLSAKTNSKGSFYIIDDAIKPGKTVHVTVHRYDQGVSDLSEGAVVPSTQSETRADFGRVSPVDRPVRPELPPVYSSQGFSCTYADGGLQWTNMGDSATYFVFSYRSGNRRYHGAQTGASMSIANAESYEVEFWGNGYRQIAECEGGPVEVFSCSYADGVLKWSGADASRYYLFAYTGDTKRYLGGHDTTTFATPATDSYEVEYWEGGTRIFAECDGPGQIGFTCSYDDGELTWTDQGADTYYVHAYTGDSHKYLGGHQALSLTASSADRYVVEHWVGGHFEAECDSDGGDPGPDPDPDPEPEVSNVALNKDATQISSWAGGAAAAGMAVDGDTNGNYFSGSVAHTATADQPWWQVDLGSSHTIESINIWNRTDCCSSRLADFVIFVSNEPFGDRSMTELTSDTSIEKIVKVGRVSSTETVWGDLSLSGRYVRVQRSATNAVLQLAEVEVMGYEN